MVEYSKLRIHALWFTRIHLLNLECIMTTSPWSKICFLKASFTMKFLVMSLFDLFVHNNYEYIIAQMYKPLIQVHTSYRRADITSSVQKHICIIMKYSSWCSVGDYTSRPSIENPGGIPDVPFVPSVQFKNVLYKGYICMQQQLCVTYLVPWLLPFCSSLVFSSSGICKICADSLWQPTVVVVVG